jgi:hypothetical protein
VPHAYAEGHPLAVGIDTSLWAALHRAPNAVGSATAWLGGLNVGYALDQLALGSSRLELRGNLRGALLGSGSFSLDAGARYELAIVPTSRFYLGPEIALGAFVVTGGEKIARFLMRGAAVASLGLGDRVQIDLLAELGFAPGGSSALLLGGGTLAGDFRF